MSARHGASGLTFVELLIAVLIIAVLASLLIPGLGRAKELARRAHCCGNLNTLGRSMGQYLANNRDTFWPGALPNYPEVGLITYFWGTKTDPVDTRPSPFMKYCDYTLRHFWCPSLRWGDYEPQGGVNEPTTCVGYNAYCLHPPAYFWKWNRLRAKTTVELPDTASLFVFADAAMAWKPATEEFFQNSTHLEPPFGPPMKMPTTHFRHLGTANALCADGHAAYYGLEGGEMTKPEHNLGFVGAQNMPHYDITNTPYVPQPGD